MPRSAASMEADNLRAALRAASSRVPGPGGAAQERLGVRPTTLASRMKASIGLGRSFGISRE